MIEQVNWLFQNYPIIKHLAAFVFVCRIVFKPAFTILKKYVELTVEEDDNKKLKRMMNTKWYKLSVFVVDMLASVKLPDLKSKKCKKCGK